MDRHDKGQAQRRGATDKAAGRECDDQRLLRAGLDIEAVVMYAHGYVQGHASCDCEVLMGGTNINPQRAPVTASTVDE